MILSKFSTVMLKTTRKTTDCGQSQHTRQQTIAQLTEAVKKMTDVCDNLSSCDELVPDRVVDDQVEISLTISGFFVFKTKVQMRQHMETRRQQVNLQWNYTQLSLLGLS